MIQTPKLSPVCNRFINLLPNVSWANSKDLWNNLVMKEQLHSRNPLMMSRHPDLKPRMRSILINWLSEVSEVYQLHRETYYLALDYFDRYLSVQSEVRQQQLQLVGVTCLFIATKIQEIYPPKVSDFAYVTDGACTEQQILTKELVILKCLAWNLNSMTVNGWLTIYMQLYTLLEKQKIKLASNSQANPASGQQCARQRQPSPNKHQPPRKRRRTALRNSPGLQVADTNKQVVIANCKKEFDVKIDSDEEKPQPEAVPHQHGNSSNNLSNITNKQSDDHQSLKRARDDSVTIKSFISSNLKLNKEQDEDELMYQKYDSFLYAQIAHLINLSMLDIGSLKFPYRVISATALYHFTNVPTVLNCTGFRLDQLQECILWMTPFALAIRDKGFDLLRLQKNELIQKVPNIQLHTVSLKLLDKAQLIGQQMLAERCNMDKNDCNHLSSDENDSSSKSSSLSSPLKNSSTILTPPRSTSKDNKV